MLTRLAPLALVMLAACEPGGGAATAPSAIAPRDLVQKALESPGDGSDILEALAEFDSAETWRRAPAGLVVSDRSLETMASLPPQSRLIGSWEKRYTPHEDTRVRTKTGLEKPREILKHTFTFRADGTCTTMEDWLSDGGCSMDRGLAKIRADGVAQWDLLWPTKREYAWRIVRDAPAQISFLVDDDMRQTIAVDVVGADELRGADEGGPFRMIRVKDAQ